MKRVCIAARIGDGKALDAGNIWNIGRSSNAVRADPGCNLKGLTRQLEKFLGVEG